MPRTLDTISTLLEIHYKQLPRMAHLALQEERLNGKLKQTEEQKNFGSNVHFRVQAEHMGMVIGAHGNNIKKAQVCFHAGRHPGMRHSGRLDTSVTYEVPIERERERERKRAGMRHTGRLDTRATYEACRHEAHRPQSRAR